MGEGERRLLGDGGEGVVECGDDPGLTVGDEEGAGIVRRDVRRAREVVSAEGDEFDGSAVRRRKGVYARLGQDVEDVAARRRERDASVDVRDPRGGCVKEGAGVESRICEDDELGARICDVGNPLACRHGRVGARRPLAAGHREGVDGAFGRDVYDSGGVGGKRHGSEPERDNLRAFRGETHDAGIARVRDECARRSDENVGRVVEEALAGAAHGERFGEGHAVNVVLTGSRARDGVDVESAVRGDIDLVAVGSEIRPVVVGDAGVAKDPGAVRRREQAYGAPFLRRRDAVVGERDRRGDIRRVGTERLDGFLGDVIDEELALVVVLRVEVEHPVTGGEDIFAVDVFVVNEFFERKTVRGEVVGILRHFRVRFCIEKVVVGGDVGDVRGGVEGDLGKLGRGRGEVRGVIARQRGVIRRLYKQGR